MFIVAIEGQSAAESSRQLHRCILSTSLYGNFEAFFSYVASRLMKQLSRLRGAVETSSQYRVNSPPQCRPRMSVSMANISIYLGRSAPKAKAVAEFQSRIT